MVGTSGSRDRKHFSISHINIFCPADHNNHVVIHAPADDANAIANSDDSVKNDLIQSACAD